MKSRKRLIEEGNRMQTSGVRNLLGTVTALALIFVSGCSTNQEYYVIAATGTVIGVEISQNPATQAPQAKLGYNRGELAIVPSNRPPCVTDQNQVTCGSLAGGAKDVPDVLMELRYGGIFDTGPSSGIYQRLAVGKTAVEQPGATLLFARNADGQIDQAAAAAMVAAHRRADEIIATRTTAIDKIVGDVVSSDGTIDKTKLQALLDATPGTEFVKDHVLGARNAAELRTRLERVSPTVLDGMVANIGA
jgi:hypothetical protein